MWTFKAHTSLQCTHTDQVFLVGLQNHETVNKLHIQISHSSFCYIFIPRHMIVVRFYGIMLDVRVCPSIRISCPDNNFSKHNGFSLNLVCALILWRSGVGLLMGKFHQILTELSAQETPIFSFLEDNLCKCQGILTKLGTCIDIKIWFGIADGQISSIFDRVICPGQDNGGVL